MYDSYTHLWLMVKLIIPSQKPRFDLSKPPLCDFRTSKAYLWGLINHRLSSITSDSHSSLNVLDAACHSAITRAMFPNALSYFGLDISFSRLRNAVDECRDSDIFYHCDLTKPIPSLHSAFDIVVSCNTLSHIPTHQQFFVLSNLVSFLRPGGHLFVNTGIDSLLFQLLQYLLPFFSSVEVTYFDSWLSYAHEPPQSRNKLDVSRSLDKYELSVINDACLHRQVLFSCSSFISRSVPVSPPNPPTGRLLKLSHLPNIAPRNYSSDLLFLEDSEFLSSVSHVLIAPFLHDHPSFGPIISYFNQHNISFFKITSSLPVERFAGSSLAVLGLESQWIGDTFEVRRVLNAIRTLSDVTLHFIYVECRNNVVSTPSVVFADC